MPRRCSFCLSPHHTVLGFPAELPVITNNYELIESWDLVLSIGPLYHNAWHKAEAAGWMD